VFAPIVGGVAHRLPRKALLISLDIVRAGIVLLMPFVNAVWQIYLLIFLLNLFSAGFKPVFSATIPDILPDEREYTQALAYSRLAYDLESVLSPLIAAFALMYVSYTELFLGNSVAFLVSSGLIVITTLPLAERKDRLGGLWGEISFGVLSYLKTPRLRALLTLYLAVSAASATVIILTPIYVLDNLGGYDTHTRSFVRQSRDAFWLGLHGGRGAVYSDRAILACNDADLVSDWRGSLNGADASRTPRESFGSAW
jgi:MFS family permease